jgi:hypothetical protein
MEVLNKEEKLQITINNLIYPNITEEPVEGYNFKIKKEIFKDNFEWVNGLITSVYGGNQIADTGDYDDFFVDGIIDCGWGKENVNLQEIIDDEAKFIMLGKPITIDLILLALEKNERDLDSCRIMFTHVNKFVYKINEDSDDIEWQPDVEFRYQDIKTQDRLYHLFCIR